MAIVDPLTEVVSSAYLSVVTMLTIALETTECALITIATTAAESVIDTITHMVAAGIVAMDTTTSDALPICPMNSMWKTKLHVGPTL